MKKILKNSRWKRIILASILGAVAGYLYYHFYGCHGSCPITGSSTKMIFFGAIFGALFAW